MGGQAVGGGVGGQTGGGGNVRGAGWWGLSFEGCRLVEVVIGGV